MAAAVHPLHSQEPAAALAARLNDPNVAASLQRLLDHADLLSILVMGLSDFVSRSETVTDSLAESVTELRGLSDSSGLPGPGELGSLVKGLMSLSGPLNDSLPTIQRLMTSDLGDPAAIDIAAMASRALVAGARNPHPPQVTGVLGLMRALKDDDVSRALGFVLSIAKALGQELRTAPGASARTSN